MALVTKQIREAPYYVTRILALAERTEGGRLKCPVLDFFRAQQNNKDFARLTALLEFTARNGPPRNETRFKHVTDGIFEFKVFQLRLLCFWDEQNLIVCTNGTVKKDQRISPAVIKIAIDSKKAYFEAKKTRKLSHEPEHD